MARIRRKHERLVETPLQEHRLATSPHFERHYDPDRAAMLAALQLVLGRGSPVQIFDEGEDL